MYQCCRACRFDDTVHLEIYFLISFLCVSGYDGQLVVLIIIAGMCNTPILLAL